MDKTVDLKPVSAQQFCWMPDAPDAIARDLNDLPVLIDFLS